MKVELGKRYVGTDGWFYRLQWEEDQWSVYASMFREGKGTCVCSKTPPHRHLAEEFIRGRTGGCLK